MKRKSIRDHRQLVLRLAGGKHRLLLELNLAGFLCECARVAPEDGAARVDMSQYSVGSGAYVRENTNQSPKPEPLTR